MSREGYFVQYPFGNSNKGGATMLAMQQYGDLVMTIAELHKRSDEFSGETLCSVYKLVERFRQGIITQTEYAQELDDLAKSTHDPRLLRAFAMYHPTSSIPNKKVTIQI